MASEHAFRFRPRFRALALGAVVLGAALVGTALVGATLVEGNRTLLLSSGAAGLVLGVLYLVSPAWRIQVLVDDDALEVRTPRARRFRLPWPEVVEVVASPGTKTCFVDGGHPERSLLVPGPGASAPYDIENKAALYDAICARVPAERVREVELLETAAAGPSRTAGAPPRTEDPEQPAETATTGNEDQPL